MDDSYGKMDADRSNRDQFMQLVGIAIGEELIGVDILSVQEILRTTTVTPIPNTPEFIEGVINLRGNIIPVIDLRKRLNLVKDEKLNPNYWVIVLVVEERVTGFIVDRVTKILNVPVESIKPPPDIVVAGLKSQYVRGVCKLDKRLLILLDFNRILMVEEIKKLKAMKRPKIPVHA